MLLQDLINLTVAERIEQLEKLAGDELKAFATEAGAQELVDAMNERKKRCDANREKQALMDQEWRTAHPRPMVHRNYPKSEPHFPGPKKSWTAEQKEKLKQVQAWNKKQTEDIAEKNRAWHAAYMTKRDDSMKIFTAEEQEDLHNFDSDSHWSIEPIPFEE